MNCSWRPNGPLLRAIWTILYTGTGYAAYLILITAGGYNKATEIALNCWLLMIINNMHWGHLMFKVRRLELCLANRTVGQFLTFVTARLFYCHSRQAAWFSCFAWVFFRRVSGRSQNLDSFLFQSLAVMYSVGNWG